MRHGPALSLFPSKYGIVMYGRGAFARAFTGMGKRLQLSSEGVSCLGFENEQPKCNGSKGGYVRRLSTGCCYDTRGLVEISIDYKNGMYWNEIMSRNLCLVPPTFPVDAESSTITYLRTKFRVHPRVIGLATLARFCCSRWTKTEQLETSSSTNLPRSLTNSTLQL